MQFRRSGQRDERRRKVLLDDTAGDKEKARAEGAVNATGKSEAVARAYAQAAVDETETRIADLIPTRPLGVFVLLLLGLTAIAGVQALYTYMPEMTAAFGGDAAAVLDVAVRGSLHGWLSSVLLGLASGAAVLIYIIRRHKMDDYRGRYRLWLWCAAALLIASVNAVAGLHHAFNAAMVHFTSYVLWTPGIGWTLAALALFGGLLGLRGLLDMWRSRGATVTLLAAVACYGSAAWLVVSSPLAQPLQAAMALSLATSLGHLLLLMSLTVYARRVLLEARGLLAVKKKVKKPAAAKKKPKASKAGAESGRKLKIDPPHNQTAAKTKRTDVDAAPAPPAAEPESQPAEDDVHGPAEGSPEWNGLSRSERKRLKKLRRRKAAA